MKKKLLIVTLNDYILYQPTILNLYDAVAPHFDATIISFEPKYIGTKKDEKRNVIYLKTKFMLEEFFQKTDFILSKIFKAINPNWVHHYFYFNYYLPRLLKNKLKSLSADVVIAVDIPALYVAQQVFGKVHFLSLEIDRSIPHFEKIDTKKIRSVFIQSEARFNHLFPGQQIKTFLVQNAPVFEERFETHYERKDFIWAGTILEQFGIFECLEFFKQYPQYRIVLKGGGYKKTMEKLKDNYANLVEQGRVVINQDYLASGAFIDFLSKFKIGFCFYSWELINKNFNYQTAPAGKLFMCLAAGTPVIACNMPGFSLVEEMELGVLVDNYEPATIFDAVKKIEANYQHFSANCYKAARQFSFDKMVQPYVDYLLEN